MSVSYTSKLGSHIIQMVAQKHAVGYPYKESERVLRVFDRFCAAGFPDAETITPEIGNAWAVIKPTEKTSSFLDRLAPVRELARYMNHAGIEAYVIPAGLAPVEAQRYIPHIFSTDSSIFICRNNGVSVRIRLIPTKPHSICFWTICLNGTILHYTR